MTIGILISDLLTHATGLTALVPSGNIFPYVANEDTTLPMIVYTIDSLEPEYDKDGWVKDGCNFSVISFSNDYASLQQIATQVRTALECGYTSGTERIEMASQDEAFNISEGVFLNKLSFNVNINEY